MAEPQAPAGWTPVATLDGWTPVTTPEGWTPTPTFRTTNATDDLGNPLIDPNTIGTAVSHLGAAVNPLAAMGTIGRALVPEAAARLISSGLTDRGAAAYGPLNALSGLGKAQGALFDRAAQAYQRGDYVSAARHFVNYLIPVLGPALDRSSDLFQAGKWVAGGADAIGLGLATFGPQAIGELAAARAAAQAGKVPQAAGASLTPAQASQNALASAEGIPLSAATATADPAVAALEKMAGHSVAGSILVARPFKTLQDAALTATGRTLAGEVHPAPMTPVTAGLAAQGRLQTVAEAYDAARAAEGATIAADVHPVPMTPLTAGEAAQGRVQGAMRTYGDTATQAYDRLRAIEADPAQVERVPTAPMGSGAARRIADTLTQGVRKALTDPDPEIAAWANQVGGRAPTVPELRVLRQMEAELDAQPYTPYLLRPTRYGGGLEPVEGTGGAGAPVYDAIKQAAPGTADMSRAEVQAAIKDTLETGQWTNASRGAYRVAQQRLRQVGGPGGPALDPAAPLLGGTRDVGMPVQVSEHMAALQPLYDRLARNAEFARQTNVPMARDEALALQALDGLLHGPAVDSVSVVDDALGKLKSLARADIPELRTAGQGVAARAVQRLSQAVDAAVAKAGPAAQEALQTGRQATIAKYGAGELYKGLAGAKGAGEAVGAAGKLLQPGDASIGLLRRVGEYTPESLPELGRAQLDAWGELTPSQRLAKWRALGAETKTQLFGTPEQVARINEWLTRSTDNDAAALYQRFRTEPEGVYQQLTAPHDAGLNFLHQVQRYAPESLPEVGRAQLEDWLTKATSEGGFQHGAKIAAEWEAYGPESKRLLFGGPAQVARINDFVGLVKRIAFNPNPSGTAHTLAVGAQGAQLAHPLSAAVTQIGGYALAKLLYSPTGVALINRALGISARAPTLPNLAASRAAWAAVANAARAMPEAAPGPVALPRAADQQAAPGTE